MIEEELQDRVIDICVPSDMASFFVGGKRKQVRIKEGWEASPHGKLLVKKGRAMGFRIARALAFGRRMGFVRVVLTMKEE